MCISLHKKKQRFRLFHIVEKDLYSTKSTPDFANTEVMLIFVAYFRYLFLKFAEVEQQLQEEVLQWKLRVSRRSYSCMNR